MLNALRVVAPYVVIDRRWIRHLEKSCTDGLSLSTRWTDQKDPIRNLLHPSMLASDERCAAAVASSVNRNRRGPPHAFASINFIDVKFAGATRRQSRASSYHCTHKLHDPIPERH